MSSRIDDLNFYNDPRNCGPAEKPVLFTQDEDGNDVEIELPTHWKVCDVCDGEGTHVNPAIDCNGLTHEDFARDPDFYEDYRRGTYDVKCNKCQGRTTVRAVDWDAMTEEQRDLYTDQLKQEAEDSAVYLAEMAMGC